MTCAAKALGCESEATQEILINGDWHPMCDEHIEFAMKVAVENAIVIHGVAMVYTPQTRPLTCTCPASQQEVDERNPQGFKRHYMTGVARTTKHSTHYEDCPLYQKWEMR